MGREYGTVVRWVGEFRRHEIAVPEWIANLPLIGASIADWLEPRLKGEQSPLAGADVGVLTEWGRIIGGQAVKGPTAKIMAELGLPVDAAAVARHYRDVLDCYVADLADAGQTRALGVPVTLTRSLMHTLADREALARVVLDAADRCG